MLRVPSGARGASDGAPPELVPLGGEYDTGVAVTAIVESAFTVAEAVLSFLAEVVAFTGIAMSSSAVAASAAFSSIAGALD
ncbi:MAG: hypothetical protein CVV47_11400 [Spirochaetae bacterium HGW-Spirochaetae-3]|nr:MAG: hypothetical protein CVV47_11400 [Spirochaetae bacterium HGW-Spirochaetae-3]